MRLRIVNILILSLLWTSMVSATEQDVLTFLNRYLVLIQEWNHRDISIYRKMQDDKVIVLDGDIANVPQITSSTSLSLNRIDDICYEAVWSNNGKVLLHIAFPIQYELILGLSQPEIEQRLQTYVMQAPSLGSASANVCSDLNSIPVQEALSCLFQHPSTGRNDLMQVAQSVYGFQKLYYTISLNQWINYIHHEELSSFVAIEDELEDAWRVLIICDSRDLAYRHILSAIVPKNFAVTNHTIINVKINAFIPTHNVKNLYEQYKDRPKHQITWSE